jgi:NTP pyrophosphatase (non-canonical NTP hydrolase)
MVRTALKGCEEMGEIAKAVLKGDKENLKEEIADVFNILMHLARGIGVDIMELAEKKLLIIEERLKKAKPC